MFYQNMMHFVDSLNRSFNGQDGRFSSAASGLVMLIFCVVFIFVSTSKSEEKIPTKPWVVEGVVLALGVISSIGLWISVLKRHSRGRLSHGANKDLPNRIKIVFLWVFGLLCIMMTCYNLAVNFDCLLLHRPELIKGEYEYGIVTQMLKVLFYIVQLGFLSSFAGHAFMTTIIQNYLISWIILTHLVLWFQNFYKTLHANINHVANETYNFPNGCFYRSNLSKFRMDLMPFTKPAITEFSLLAVELLIVMWICSEGGNHEDQREEFNYIAQEDESTNLLPEATHPSRTSSTSRRYFVITNTFYICILIGTVLSLPFVVSCVVILYSANITFRHYEAFIIILLIFYLEHLILILATFVQLRKFSQWRKIRITTQYKNIMFILLLAMTGAMTYSTFEILASIEGTTCQNASRGLGMNSSKLRNFLNIVQLKTILEMLTMFLQTLLIRQSWHMEKCIVSRKVQTIKKLFGVLCLINLVLWLGFSVLFDEHLRTMVIESCFYGKPFWRGIRNAIFPLVVFYRFHASMHFYERCKRYH